MNPVPSSHPLYDFISTSLASSGLCILHPPFIQQVAPHLLGAGGWFDSDPIAWPGATRWRVSVKGLDETVLVLARSERNLALRVEERLGAEVESFERAADPGAAARMKATIQALSDEARQKKLRKLRATAVSDLPAQGTPRWREIMEAREELARMEGEDASLA